MLSLPFIFKWRNTRWHNRMRYEWTRTGKYSLVFCTEQKQDFAKTHFNSIPQSESLLLHNTWTSSWNLLFSKSAFPLLEIHEWYHEPLTENPFTSKYLWNTLNLQAGRKMTFRNTQTWFFVSSFLYEINFCRTGIHFSVLIYFLPFHSSIHHNRLLLSLLF